MEVILERDEGWVHQQIIRKNTFSSWLESLYFGFAEIAFALLRWLFTNWIERLLNYDGSDWYWWYAFAVTTDVVQCQNIRCMDYNTNLSYWGMYKGYKLVQSNEIQAKKMKSMISYSNPHCRSGKIVNMETSWELRNEKTNGKTATKLNLSKLGIPNPREKACTLPLLRGTCMKMDKLKWHEQTIHWNSTISLLALLTKQY